MEEPNAEETAEYLRKNQIETDRHLKDAEALNFPSGDYHVFHNGIDPSDIRQGALGDCWFLCAIAAMTEFPELVENLFPVHDVNEAGGPIYSRCNGNELWVLLLEKAYSKLCGSYEAIKSGWAYEGMMDLTGAPYKTIRLDDADLKPRIESGQLWTDLLNYDLESYIMSASTPGEDVYTETGARPGRNGTGLVAGHAYTLISVKEIKSGVKLVKLRNPWGNTEWNGDWSNNSSLWTDAIAAELGGHTKEDDGSFWMSFEDMLKHFFSINICMTRHAGRKHPWKEERRKFLFDFNNDEEVEDAHRITCPNYILRVTAPGTFIVSVHQEDIRCEKAKPYMDIGVSVLKVHTKANPDNINEDLHWYTLEQGTGNSSRLLLRKNEPIGV
eukprot:gene35448-43707_t